MNSDKKGTATKKDKVAQNDKYYKINADFSYLKQYNYKITKQIGRGGYGVVYKVRSFLFRPTILTTPIICVLSKSTSIQFLASLFTPKWHTYKLSRGNLICLN